MKSFRTTQQTLFHAVGEVSLIYTRKHITIPFSKITSPDEAYTAFRSIFDRQTIEHKECVYAMYLDRANTILGYAQISSGGVSQTVIDPKIVFQYALKLNASGIILAHNHPSGKLTPSAADKSITEKIQKSGKLMDIELLDHLILNRTNYSTV